MAPYRTETRLADGRRLYYFDGSPVRRDDPDSRDLPPADTGSQLRWDPLREQWVVIAAHRQDRTYHPPVDMCPLCPSTPDRLTEIPSGDYEVVVFENRFPALSASSAAVGPVPAPAGGGRCEVVCFTSDHDASFAELPERRVRTVIEAWIDRTRALSAEPGVAQVFVFENRGAEIGVTLAHPHGQIYGYPFVPADFERMLTVARRHRDRHGDCLGCTLLRAERTTGIRVVAENPHWTAFVPHAARWPYEVHLHPRRHVADLPGLDSTQRDSLAGIYGDVLRRFDRLFDGPTPYVAAWIQAPAHRDHDLAHLHAQICSIRRSDDKMKYLAGSEAAAGAFINDITPEEAATRLRQ